MALTQKQERFAFNIAVKGMTQHNAWVEAGYSSNYPSAIVDQNSCRMASKLKARIQELRDEMQAGVKSDKIASEIERKEILSDIARDKKQNSVHAIDVHNKMDKIYNEASVLQDNRVVNILVIDEATRGLMLQVKDRTGKLIEGDVIDES